MEAVLREPPPARPEPVPNKSQPPPAQQNQQHTPKTTLKTLTPHATMAAVKGTLRTMEAKSYQNPAKRRQITPKARLAAKLRHDHWTPARERAP
jgi:hypothetical protein